MSMDLREQIIKLLSDISGELDPEDEEKIVTNACQRLSSKEKINEEMIIDAVLASFQNDDDVNYDYFDDDKDELFDLLRVSSYDDDDIRYALNNFDKISASEYDMHRGSIGSYYDPKGKDYRPADQKKKTKPKMEEFEILDEAHKDIEYHNEATKTDKSHRTRADMLVRG